MPESCTLRGGIADAPQSCGIGFTVDSSGRFALRNMIGEYEFSLAGLGPGLAIRRIVRNGVLMPMSRIRVSGGEVVDGLEIVVGLP